MTTPRTRKNTRRRSSLADALNVWIRIFRPGSKVGRERKERDMRERREISNVVAKTKKRREREREGR